MNHNDFTQLEWRPVLLIKVMRVPFLEPSLGLLVQRVYLAEHRDGILRADWTLPADERFFPLVQLVGWNPERDVLFRLPVKFHRHGDPRIISLLPSGTWILPYDETLYQVYTHMQVALTRLVTVMEASPDSGQLRACLTRIITEINQLNDPDQK
jgi:hypothetical protein